MKAAIAAIALTVVATTAPIGAAHAHGGVAVRVDTPEFGIRIGAPFAIPGPVWGYGPPVPVYVPPPVYVPAPVFYGPPHVVIGAPAVHPVIVPYGYAPRFKHRKHGYAYPHQGIVAVRHRHGRDD